MCDIDIYDDKKQGKMYVHFSVKDRAGRPLLVMRPRFQNTKDHDDQIAYFVYIMERASQICDAAGEEKMCWVVDFPGYSMVSHKYINVLAIK
jgi:hypothetical protein